MGRRKKCWTYTAGRRPHRVTVYEREASGVLYARGWSRGKIIRRSLGHRNRDRAMEYADQEAVRMRNGADDIRAGRVRLARLLALYKERETPKKRAKQQSADRRRAQMWLRFLGPERDPHRITRADWDNFIQARGKGTISPRGELMAEGEARPAGPRTVGSDCQWLQTVLAWGMGENDHQGRYLLRENVARGYPVPSEKNPHRPVATQEDFEALAAVADQVTMRVWWRGKPEIVRSYLPEILVLANETGRRIGALSRLTFGDLRLDQGPHGSIDWPARSDKMGKAWGAIPMTAQARAAIDRIRRERPGIGSAPLFPSPRDVGRPVSVHYAEKLLRKGVRKAGIKVPDRWGWHSLRRKFASEVKQLSDVDAAALAGWSDPTTMVRIYQRPDMAGMLYVLANRRELRQAR